MSVETTSECPALRRALDLTRACHRALLASTTEPDLLQAICDCMVRQGHYAAAWIHRADEDEPAAAAGGPSRERAGSLALPLAVGGQRYGTLHLAADGAGGFDEQETELVGEVVEDIEFGLAHFALTERQRRLEDLVEAAPDMIGFAEPGSDGAPPRPTYLNPAGQALLADHGDGPDGILGSHPEWAARRLQEEGIPAARQWGSWRGETAVIGPDGEEIPVDQTLIAHAGPTGELRQISTIVHDIRARKRYEEALRRQTDQAESVTQGLLDALPGLFYLYDAQGRLHRWNQELERVTGIPRAELPRRRPESFFPADHAPRIERAFRRTLDSGYGEAEADLLTPDGRVPHSFQARRISLDGWPFVLGTAMDVSERRAAEERNRLTATVFDAAHDALMITDPDGCILEVNPAFTEQTGYSREEAVGAVPGSLLDSHEHRPGFFEAVFAEVNERGCWEGTIQNRRRDGSTVFHRETIASVRDAEGRISHYVATMADVTPIKEAEQRARREREVTDAVVDSLPGIFFFLDQQGYNHRCNRRAVEYAGRGEEECGESPVPALSFFSPVDRPVIRRHIQAGFETGQAGELESEIVAQDGSRTPILFNASPIEIGGETYLCGLGIDIRRRRELETELRHLARTDPLTGACNRAGFHQGVSERLAEAQRYGHPFAVALMDLDHFKALNDHHGHQAGDRLLEALVEQLQGLTREVDTICRWGGEEFIVMLPHTDLAGARGWAQRLQEHLAAGPLVSDLPPVTVSIGLTEYRPGDDADSLIHRADQAMYAAKEAGRDRIDSR